MASFKPLGEIPLTLTYPMPFYNNFITYYYDITKYERLSNGCYLLCKSTFFFHFYLNAFFGVIQTKLKGLSERLKNLQEV